MSDTFWCGSEAKKLYLQSGQFSSTIKTSLYVGDIEGVPSGISWDGTNTLWTGYADRLILQSGKFSSTIKASLDVSGFENYPEGISSDGTDTPWCGATTSKLYLQSGQFSSTIKASLDVSGIEGAYDISWDGTNTPWAGLSGAKLYLQSGKFSSTIKTSLYIGDVDTNPLGISWDGTNTPWCGRTDDKLYLQSGQFSSTLKTSLDVSGIDTEPYGIEHGDFAARTPEPPIELAGAISGISSVSGSLKFEFEFVALRSSIAGISGVFGSLNSQPGLGEASVVEITGVSAALGSLEVATELVGSVAGTSDVSGSLDSQPGCIGSIDSGPGAFGYLSNIKIDIALVSFTTEISDVSGSLDSQPELRSSIAGISGVSGFLDSQPGLGEASVIEIAGVSATSGSVKVETTLNGSAVGTSDISYVDLDQQPECISSTTGISGVVGFLDSQPGLGEASVVEISGVSASLGSLEVATELIGSTVGIFDVSGSLGFDITIITSTSARAKSIYDMLERKGIDGIIRTYPDMSYDPEINKTTLGGHVDYDKKIIPPYKNREGYKSAELITSGKGLTGIASYQIEFVVKAGLIIFIASKVWTVIGVTEVKDHTGILLYLLEIEAGD